MLYSLDYHLQTMVKTTINIPYELWKRFSIKVIKEHGGGKNTFVIEKLIRKYLKKKNK